MTELKKMILIGYCVATAIAALYVPWKVDYRTNLYSTEIDQGYAFFFAPPVPVATIDYGKVLLECVVIASIAAVLYVLSDRFKK